MDGIRTHKILQLQKCFLLFVSGWDCWVRVTRTILQGKEIWERWQGLEGDIGIPLFLLQLKSSPKSLEKRQPQVISLLRADLQGGSAQIISLAHWATQSWYSTESDSVKPHHHLATGGKYKTRQEPYQRLTLFKRKFKGRHECSVFRVSRKPDLKNEA